MEVFSTVTKQDCIDYLVKGREETYKILKLNGLDLAVLDIIDGIIKYMETMPEKFVDITTGEIINE